MYWPPGPAFVPIWTPFVSLTKAMPVVSVMLALVVPLLYMRQEQGMARSPIQECSPIIIGMPTVCIPGTSPEQLLPERMTRFALTSGFAGVTYEVPPADTSAAMESSQMMHAE